MQKSAPPALLQAEHLADELHDYTQVHKSYYFSLFLFISLP